MGQQRTKKWENLEIKGRTKILETKNDGKSKGISQEEKGNTRHWKQNDAKRNRKRKGKTRYGYAKENECKFLNANVNGIQFYN